MVRIRLQRHGSKKRPHYRIVAADSRNRRDGRMLEKLGFYNPFTSEEIGFRLLKEPTLRWYFKGAQATDTAYALMKRAGVVEMIRLIKTKKLTLDDALEQARKDDETMMEKVRAVSGSAQPAAAPAASATPAAETAEEPVAAVEEETSAAEVEAEAQPEAEASEPAAETAEAATDEATEPEAAVEEPATAEAEEDEKSS